MKRRLCLIMLFAGTWGCDRASQPVQPLYTTGQRLLLEYRAEMLDEGFSCSVTEIGDKVVERKETRRSSRGWVQMEVVMDVKASQQPGCAAVSMKIRRLRNGSSYQNEEGDTHEVAHDTASAPAGNGQALKEHKEDIAAMKALVFSAVVNEAGEVVDFDATGGHFDSLKRKWSEHREIPRDRKQAALRVQSWGVFSALSDAAAYLPSAEVQIGQKWTVRRQQVFPYRAYEFYMLTNGCGYSTEQATCVARSVKSTPSGRIAEVEITGKCFPRDPERGMPKRVRCMDISGTLRCNVDTGEIIAFRIESTPRFLNAEDKRMMAVTFVDSVTLSPLRR